MVSVALQRFAVVDVGMAEEVEVDVGDCVEELTTGCGTVGVDVAIVAVLGAVSTVLAPCAAPPRCVSPIGGYGPCAFPALRDVELDALGELQPTPAQRTK